MKKFTKFFGLGMICVALAALIVPVAAQEADPGAGQGGIIVESNFGGDVTTFIPILSSSTVDGDVADKMWPAIIGGDPVTFEPTPGAPQSLATGWEYDETGTVLTITLREDAFWGDGEQITADDYIYAVNAVKSGLTSSARTSALYQLDDGTVTGGPIHAVNKIDDFTVEVVLGQVVTDDEGEIVLDEEGNPVLSPDCVAINDINDITVMPAHAFEANFGEDYAALDADPYFVPETDGGIATWGPFTDPFIENGVQVSLLADQNYNDTQLGYVAPSEWLYQNVESQTVEFERFLAGDFSYLTVSAENQNGLRGNPDFQFIEYPANGYTYMGYNLADPNNPQPGRDADGNIIDQGLHPIFGDVLVRRAIAHATNVNEIIGTRPEGDNPATGILEGNGFPIATHNHPGLSSTDDELEELGVAPLEFDIELAQSLLEEAGWVDTDGNGIRECVDCLYAREVDPEFAGSEMEFELLTNAGNVARESTAETLVVQLGEIGIRVNFQAIEFGTLVDELLAQQFDALIIGWSLGLPFSPGGGLDAFFGIGNDRPGAGFNYVSYQNPELDELVAMADSLPAAEDGSYPACDPATRDQLYAEGQAVVWEDQPYLWLFAGNVMFAAQANIANFDPLPYNPIWNLDAFTVLDQ